MLARIDQLEAQSQAHWELLRRVYDLIFVFDLQGKWSPPLQALTTMACFVEIKFRTDFREKRKRLLTSYYRHNCVRDPIK